MSVESPAFADVNVMKRHLPLQYKGHSRESENLILNQVEDDGQRVSTISAPVKLTEASPVFSLKAYFADLPVASNTNLEILTPLLGQSPDVDLRKQIIDRYLDIYNIRKARGIYGPPEVNLEMAIALIDNDTFLAVCEVINKQGEIIEVATHELGHAVVASALGWHVESMTVVPASTYLGLTVTSPNGAKGLSSWAVESAAISYGGAIAAKMAGHDVRGHGADMAAARVKARIAMADPNCPFSSEGEILTYAQNLAHSSLARSGSASIHKMALDLAYRKTVV